MDRRDASKGGAVVLVAVMATLLAGCVVNPYIRTSSVPDVGELSRDNCRDLVVTTADHQLVMVDKAKTLLYAECVRDAMAKKAGRYAVMNNGGAVVLLNMAGLAGYSGVRGGHNAQVAALTTGGATYYGAQQYLYRKPREAIYWSGANAIGCAVGVTQRRLLVADEVRTLEPLKKRAIETTLDTAARDARVALQATPAATGCSGTMQAEHALLTTQTQDILSSKTGEALKARQAALLRRYQVLTMVEKYALADLVAATNAIRDSVNDQLAAEQPDPSQLAKLLTSLKLPGLEGASGGAGDPQSRSAPRQFAQAPPPPSAGGGEQRGPKSPTCQRSDIQHATFKSSTTALIDQYNALNRTLDELEASLDGIATRSGTSPGSGDTLKYCTLARTNTLLPFGLQLDGNGTQTVVPGETLSIPITGGVPPYAIRTVSGGSGLTATIKLDTDGSYRIVIIAGDDAESGTFFAKDAVGAGEVVTVNVSTD